MTNTFILLFVICGIALIDAACLDTCNTDADCRIPGICTPYCSDCIPDSNGIKKCSVYTCPFGNCFSNGCLQGTSAPYCQCSYPQLQCQHKPFCSKRFELEEDVYTNSTLLLKIAMINDRMLKELLPKISI